MKIYIVTCYDYPDEIIYDAYLDEKKAICFFEEMTKKHIDDDCSHTIIERDLIE